MSAHLVSLRPVAELRDARRMAHRLIVTKPAAPGRLILSLWCLEIGAELKEKEKELQGKRLGLQYP